MKNSFFDNGGTNLYIKLSKDTCDHVNNNFIMVADPHNMDLYILFCGLSAIQLYWLRYSKNRFCNNGGTNLHKNNTWDILLTC